MDRQIIEISNNGFFLSLYRGFLVIENEKKQKQEIPLDNILSLVLSADTLNEAIYDFVGSLVSSFEDKKVLLKYPQYELSK